MGEMAASIAHEINQPLAAIVSNANAGLRWLARRPPDLSQGRRRAAAGRAGWPPRQRGDRQRAGDVQARRPGEGSARIAVNPFIEEALALLQRQLEASASPCNAAGRGLRVCWPTGCNCSRWCLNLISNAIDAMREAHDRPRELRSSRERSGAGRGADCRGGLGTPASIPRRTSGSSRRSSRRKTRAWGSDWRFAARSWKHMADVCGHRVAARTEAIFQFTLPAHQGARDAS